MSAEHVVQKNDSHGAPYVGILISGERHWIAEHEAESLARALTYKIAARRKCG